MIAGDDFQTYLAAIVDAGIALIVGTSDADGRPRAGRAWSVSVVPGEEVRLRISVTADDPNLVANLMLGPVALTGTDVGTFRSFQCKGRALLVEPPDLDDLEAYHVQTDRLLSAIRATDHTQIDVVRRMLPRTVVMTEVAVEQIFDQTPGPGAGAPMFATAT